MTIILVKGRGDLKKKTMRKRKTRGDFEEEGPLVKDNQ